MTIDNTLGQDLSEAKRQARERFETQTVQPMGNGLVGVNAVGAFVDYVELSQDVSDAYKSVFLRRGEKATRNYLESRRVPFGRAYRAARLALEEMQSE